MQTNTIQLLISTVDNQFMQRQYTPPFSDTLIINQSITLAKTEHQQAENIINENTIGLSKSRNKALEKAHADICVISDDDTTFFNHTESTILGAFAEHPNADIITFQTQHPDGSLAKKYAKKPYSHKMHTITKVSSIEIAFKRKAILTQGIKFDEKFGLGAKFPSGEENIFLLDALKKGLKIHYIPTPIAEHIATSSGKALNNPNLITAKGAVFYRMFGAKAYLLCLLFALKKRHLSEINPYRLYQLMLNGIKEYKAY